MKSDNIFWKMIREQKKNIINKPEPKDNKTKLPFSKPIKKLNSTILEKIEKAALNTSFQPLISKKSSIKKESQELEKIEKLSTFNKIIHLQNLCKEMISMKERFGKNKTEMINKINSNCFNYYKYKIEMKEIFDYCKAKKPEDHIDYVIIEEPEKYLADKYNDIYNFLFMLKNNNKLMLKLINHCEKENFEQLSDFIVNFCYEDTISSSFIQEELMLFIYLIFEKNFYDNLPENIKIDDNIVSYNIFRSKSNILYYIIKSLTRKADIRNFLCSILVDDILKLEGKQKYLSPDIFSPKNIEENKFQDDNNKEKEQNPIQLLKKSTYMDTKLKLKLNLSKENIINRTNTNIDNESNENNLVKIDDDNNRKEEIIFEQEKKNNEIENNIEQRNNNIIDENNINEIKNNEFFNPFLLLENESNYDLKIIVLDQFFEKNNTVLDFISKKLQEYEHYSKTNNVNLAMIDYLNNLIKNINEEKNKNKDDYEIYSNLKIINVLKIIKIKEGEKEKDNLENDNSFNKTTEIIKNNYYIIEEIINEIIEKLDENITSVPFTIKCISNIIEQLLNVKYKKKLKKNLSHYQKYIFKSNFFIGNILLSSLINRDYNGIITSGVTSKITTENLKIIYDIFHMLLSGNLFKNNEKEYFFYTIFNKLIIKIVPKIFYIIDKIEKKFKLPDTIQRLINTITDKNNDKRLNDFEYDYFFEKNEDIQYQSLCINFENLGLLSHLMNEIKNKEDYINNINNEEKILLEKICNYENYFYKMFKTIKDNNQKCEYIILHKLTFNSKIENKKNYILKDNLTDNNNNLSNFSKNKINFIIFKKCLIEILGYTNILDKNSFIHFTENKKALIHNFPDKKKIYKINRRKEYNDIIFEGKSKNNNIEQNINGDINFKNDLFQKVMDFIKYEMGFNLENPKSQRIIFCTSFIQSHMEEIPEEYSKNNYCKLFLELTKETWTILNYLNSNILNQIYNKIKEGNKLNMIIASNFIQIKSMEKYKCIEYLYSKILIPNKFEIKKNEKNIITKVEYIREKTIKKVEPPPLQTEINKDKEIQNQNSLNNSNIEKKETKEKSSKINKNEKKNKDINNNEQIIKNNNEQINKNSCDPINKNVKNEEQNNKNINNSQNINNNFDGNTNNNIIKEINNPPLIQIQTPPPPKLESIKKFIEIIPNYREFENDCESIIKLEEETGIADALKNFFRTMKILVKKEKVVQRFSKDEIDSIVIELENYILFKLYDKLYPTRSCKEDIIFYKKCCRLNFIKPNNLITDKNIVNEKLWNTSMDYLNKIESKYNPADKIKIISKAFGILQNSITFCSGKKELGVDDTIKPLIYILIKAKPKNIFNNYNYCQLFLNGDLAKKEFGILLTQIYMIIRIIKEMKYNELIDVTEQQFGKDEDI